ncbi:MAG: hypothetical protein ACO3C1_02695, partial [Ilumatobacteraceae bacterium]
MRARAALLVAATSCLAAALFVLLPVVHRASATTPVRSAAADRWFVDTMLYRVTLSQFLANVGVDRWFDWSTDWCSAPLIGSTGRSFDFPPACRRPAFGYRHLRLLDR